MRAHQIQANRHLIMRRIALFSEPERDRPKGFGATAWQIVRQPSAFAHEGQQAGVWIMCRELDVTRDMSSAGFAKDLHDARYSNAH